MNEVRIRRMFIARHTHTPDVFHLTEHNYGFLINYLLSKFWKWFSIAFSSFEFHHICDHCSSGGIFALKIIWKKTKRLVTFLHCKYSCFIRSPPHQFHFNLSLMRPKYIYDNRHTNVVNQIACCVYTKSHKFYGNSND